jgi:hypothetical protein
MASMKTTVFWEAAARGRYISSGLHGADVLSRPVAGRTGTGQHPNSVLFVNKE